MESYIVRIYRYQTNKPERLVGTIEEAEASSKIAFTSIDELWEALQSHQDDSQKQERFIAK